MATIGTAVRLNDMMSDPIHSITNAMNMMLSAWDSLDDATSGGLDIEGVEAIRAELNNATRALDQLGDEQEEFNRNVDRGSDALDGMTSKIFGAIGAYASFEGLKALVNLSDTFTQTTARLGMIVDEGSNVEDLFDDIYAAANRARAPIQSMADSVAKLSLNAGDAFGSNDETILFAENLSKLFAIAGTEQASMEGATTQLIQALGSGVLRGEEFNSVFEAAPNIMQTVADYMDVPIGQLRSMAAEGQITADVVKNALLSATGEINERFESMPMTWGQVWTGIMNNLYYASIPLLEMINALANNWSVIQPIVLGVAGVIGVYLIAVYGATAATQAWAAAQAILNNVMAMNPVFRIIMIITVLISLFYAVIAAINKVQGTTISATGVITGVVYSLFAFLWNIVAAFVNFFANVWNDPIGSIARLFADLADNVLGILEVIAKGIDAVFGSDLSGAVAGWRSGLSDMITETFGEGEEFAVTIDPIEAFNKGYEFGEGLSDSVGDIFGGNAIGDFTNIGDIPTYDDLPKNVGNIADSTGSIANSLDVTNENLKYLRDLAETEVVNRFTTAEIRVDMGGVTNQVNQNVDLDGVVDYMVTSVQEAMERVAEGVHE